MFLPTLLSVSGSFFSCAWDAGAGSSSNAIAAMIAANPCVFIVVSFPMCRGCAARFLFTHQKRP
jgi:hypothetical protein